ncbi:MAG: hypothetical protein P1P90_02945 [Patescibacteria group bacterium]|nr:hypothetical protein [Patescibacteria group bacterium]
MKKSTTRKTPKIMQTNESAGSDFVWAAVTIMSLPVVAISLTAMGLHPALGFILGGCFTFILIILEAIIRGKTWIFSETFQNIFGHSDTSFRLLIVAGGALLILQTAFVLQLLRNPNMDTMLLNLIIQKQCLNNTGPLTDILCPTFKTVTADRIEQLPLIYSMEQAAKSHLIPSAVFGSCAVAPLKDVTQTGDKINLEFFAYCQPWTKGLNGNTEEPVMRIINADFFENDKGFYSPQTWQETKSGTAYNHLTKDQNFLLKLGNTLLKRHEETLRMYAF